MGSWHVGGPVVRALYALVVSVLLPCLFVVGTSAPAHASCAYVKVNAASAAAGVTAFSAGVHTETKLVCSPGPSSVDAPGSANGSGSAPEPISLPPGGEWRHSSECRIVGGGRCTSTETCADGSSATSWWYETADYNQLYQHETCPSAPSAERKPQLTVEMIANGFRTLPMPAAPLVIQPPNGKTLVNFRTVFYTTQQPFDRSIRLLGHRVDFRIKPSEYTFLFGDGHWLTTHEPGKPFTTVEALDGNITHKYLTKGTFHPSLNTTYGADFRVDGGAWRPVNGTVTIEGPKLALETLTATPVLVD